MLRGHTLIPYTLLEGGSVKTIMYGFVQGGSECLMLMHTQFHSFTDGFARYLYLLK